jgi:hypothetical protein
MKPRVYTSDLLYIQLVCFQYIHILIWIGPMLIPLILDVLHAWLVRIARKESSKRGLQWGRNA